jgi:hypothetical protein
MPAGHLSSMAEEGEAEEEEEEEEEEDSPAAASPAHTRPNSPLRVPRPRSPARPGSPARSGNGISVGGVVVAGVRGGGSGARSPAAGIIRGGGTVWTTGNCSPHYRHAL